jgi:hypothetical protein
VQLPQAKRALAPTDRAAMRVVPAWSAEDSGSVSRPQVGRHRAPPRSWWSLLAAALVGVALGAWLTALLTLPHQPVAAPPPPPTLSAPAPPPPPTLTGAVSTTASQGQAVTFGEALTGPDGVQVTALPPHKIKGGVRLAVSAVNMSSAPVTVSTERLGPHEVRFRDRPVEMVKEATTVRLVPGEGYVYTCEVRLPDMSRGRLSFGLGAGTVAGDTAGD